MLPTQLVFKVDKLSEYERDELLKKWQLDKLLQQRKESESKEVGDDNESAPFQQQPLVEIIEGSNSNDQNS